MYGGTTPAIGSCANNLRTISLIKKTIAIWQSSEIHWQSTCKSTNFFACDSNFIKRILIMRFPCLHTDDHVLYDEDRVI